MKLSDVEKIIKPIAPILASVIPGGGAAVELVKVALDLGADATPDDIAEAIKANPESAVKLVEIERTHKLELEKLAVSIQLAEMADRANARAQNVELNRLKGRNTQSDVICYGVMALLFSIITAGVWFGKEVPDAVLIGVLNLAVAIVSFHFGSSAGSKANGEALRAAFKNGGNGNGSISS